MKKIYIYFWKRQNSVNGYKHGAEFDYSIKKQHEIIDHIISCGENIMLIQKEDSLIIWIDNKNFKQS